MRSMTGFGRSTVVSQIGTVSVEIKSVNSRFLEVHVHSDDVSPLIEATAKECIKDAISRGKVHLNLSFKPSVMTGYGVPIADEELLESTLLLLQNIKKKKGLKKGKVTLSELLAIPLTWVKEQKMYVPEENLLPVVRESITSALVGLENMRREEGHNLAKDLQGRLGLLNEKCSFLNSKQGIVIREYELRLRMRIQKICTEMHTEFDDSRILQEIAIHADKTDYTEELTRFKSHLDQFVALLEEDSPVGRQLDFLLQEINREVNTIASKSTDPDIIDCVIIVKTELEKIREQVQNIE